MPAAKRQPHPHTEDWEQLQQLTLFAEQRRYERMRGPVVFGDPITAHAQAVQMAERTLRQDVHDFEQYGMLSLFRPFVRPDTADGRTLTPPMRQHLVDCHFEAPQLSFRELGTICYVKFGRRPDHHTVKKIVATGPAPSIRERRYRLWNEMDSPYERHKAIIDLHIEGWRVAAIAQYLSTSRPTIYTWLQRFAHEGYDGLANRPSANTRPVRKVDLALKLTAQQLLDQSDIGAFRLHAALRQRGYHISDRTCSRIIEENRRLYQIPKPSKEPYLPKEMPFKAQRRHQFWSVDVRYIEDHQLPDQEGPFYVISILENFSRTILASDISRTQTQEDYLKVLQAAIWEHGAPEALVTDGGTIFRAKTAMLVYSKLGIRKEQIDKRQAWQNYIESAFNILRKMADYGFAQSLSWEAAQLVHEQWLVDYNNQPHWAHRKRDDDKRTPWEVLNGAKATRFAPDQLRRLFRNRYERQANRSGYIRFRQWKFYAEAGLAKMRVAVWITRQTLTVEYDDLPLAQYDVQYQPDAQHFSQVHPLHFFETPFMIPRLMSGNGIDWYPVRRVSSLPRQQTDPFPLVQQATLFEVS